MFGFGTGATWSGEIALRIDPHVLRSLFRKITKGTIVVAGTNGKTTTSRMIKTLLEKEGYSVLHNDSGANLLNGVVSAFFVHPKASYDYAVFEVDENALPSVLSHLRTKNQEPVTIVLLNLFRDQLDRYGEVDTIADHWKEALQMLDAHATVVLNADDPHLSYIGTFLKTSPRYFGLGDKTYYLPHMQHATDTIYCPSCGERLTFAGVYFSHLGDWECKKCTFTHPPLNLSGKDVLSPVEGVYNIYNTLAATLVGQTIGLDTHTMKKSIASFHPAFGRMETCTYKGKTMRILLSKNPTGCNESLRTMLASKDKGPLLMLLNDRIPDGTDVSWIWDVDFEMLVHDEHMIILSGDRALDMGVRVKYGITNYKLRMKNKTIILEKNLEKAVRQFTDVIKSGETGWIIATYSAMLDVRKIITGKKIL